VAERVRFYFDQHVPEAVSRALHRRGIDVLTTQQAGRCGESDQEQLEFATAQGRVFVTFDDDFLRIAARGIHHNGIAFSSASRYTVGELVYALLLLCNVLEAADMEDHVEFL
jgi:hypothetical protein